MSLGFSSKDNTNVVIYKDEVENLIKKYKKIKKYMKSSIYKIKTMDGTEELVSELLKEYEDNPVD
jgi:effector-binding domain-containing protein